MANIQRKNWQIPRRTLLKGIGATLALPLFEAMSPLLAATTKNGTSPIRMACLFFPNGVRPDRWTPESKDNLTLSPILSPLESMREEILILSGLSNKASFKGDGHYAKASGWLTGTSITKTTGANINANGIQLHPLIRFSHFMENTYCSPTMRNKPARCLRQTFQVQPKTERYTSL